MYDFCKTKSDEEKWNEEDLQHRLQKISEMNGTYLVMLRMLQRTGGMLLERNTITATWATTVPHLKTIIDATITQFGRRNHLC